MSQIEATGGASISSFSSDFALSSLLLLLLLMFLLSPKPPAAADAPKIPRLVTCVLNRGLSLLQVTITAIERSFYVFSLPAPDTYPPSSCVPVSIVRFWGVLFAVDYIEAIQSVITGYGRVKSAAFTGAVAAVRNSGSFCLRLPRKTGCSV